MAASIRGKRFTAVAQKAYPMSVHVVPAFQGLGHEQEGSQVMIGAVKAPNRHLRESRARSEARVRPSEVRTTLRRESGQTG